MKKLIALVLVLAICFSFSACKSSEAKEVEELIGKLGTITLDSKEDIEKISKLYEGLSDKEKDGIENIKDFEKAKDAYNELIGEELLGLIENVNTTFTAYDVVGLRAAVEEVKQFTSTLSPDTLEFAKSITKADDGTSLLDDIDKFVTLLESTCANNTIFVLPEYVISVTEKGGWLVNDHGDFAAYNTWMEDEADLKQAFEEYKEYAATYGEIVSEDATQFVARDPDGNEITVLMLGSDDSCNLQVRVPRF